MRDAAILLSALAGRDPRDAATATALASSRPTTRSFLDPNGLRGARIGVARKYFGFNDAVDQLMDDALGEMKRQGADHCRPRRPALAWQVR